MKFKEIEIINNEWYHIANKSSHKLNTYSQYMTAICKAHLLGLTTALVLKPYI